MPPQNDVLADDTLIDDRYRIVRQIGRGAMGAVYEGENLRIARRVAIKVIHPDLATRADLVQRFEREARAAARIGSPHVADVLDLGALPTGEPYIVMEYLDGESLLERFKARVRLTPLEVYPIATQLLDGLAAVHEAGIIHRDLKPANIFLCRADAGDFVKVLDLGVCKLYEFGAEGIITTGSQVLGTPAYMAPEQLGGPGADPRSDVYSVGVVLYRALTGQLPFSASSLRELLLSICRQEAPPPLELVPSLDPAVAAIVTKAMSAEPSDRFSDARAMKAAFVDWHQRSKTVERELAAYLERPQLRVIETPPPIPAPRATRAAPQDLPGPRESLVGNWTAQLASAEPATTALTLPSGVDANALEVTTRFEPGVATLAAPSEGAVAGEDEDAPSALPAVDGPRHGRRNVGPILLALSVSLLSVSLVVYWLVVLR